MAIAPAGMAPPEIVMVPADSPTMKESGTHPATTQEPAEKLLWHQVPSNDGTGVASSAVRSNPPVKMTDVPGAHDDPVHCSNRSALTGAPASTGAPLLDALEPALLLPPEPPPVPALLLPPKPPVPAVLLPPEPLLLLAAEAPPEPELLLARALPEVDAAVPRPPLPPAEPGCVTTRVEQPAAFAAPAPPPRPTSTAHRVHEVIRIGYHEHCRAGAPQHAPALGGGAVPISDTLGSDPDTDGAPLARRGVLSARARRGHEGCYLSERGDRDMDTRMMTTCYEVRLAVAALGALLIACSAMSGAAQPSCRSARMDARARSGSIERRGGTMSDSPLVDEAIPSPHCDQQTDRKVIWVVIHDEEAQELPVTAHNVAELFAEPNGPHVSAHYTVDLGKIVQCVAEKDIAWAAGHTGNVNGLHIEISGYASQSQATWLADGSMLDRAARLTADICARLGLPAVFVDADGLKAGTPGITTHGMLSAAFPRETDHTDPGPNFPMDAFLQKVGAQLASSAPASAPLTAEGSPPDGAAAPDTDSAS
jgi:N-acetyl-anhydromuramyl-L-alanine amidase AmpD